MGVLHCCSQTIFYFFFLDSWLPFFYLRWRQGVFEQGNNMLWQNVTEAHALTSNRPISIYGDSLGRQTLIALGNAIYGHNQTQITFSNEDRHKDKKFLLKNGAVVHFYWSPYVATTMKLIQANANAMAKNELIVVSNGL